MKTVVPTFGALLAVLAFAASTASATPRANPNRAPDYSAWTCSQQVVQRYEVVVRSCEAPQPGADVVQDVSDLVIEMAAAESREPALLIWTRTRIGGNDAHMRFYRRDSGAWVFVDAVTFERATLPPGVRAPLFAFDSEFGRLYRTLVCRRLAGQSCSAPVPTFRF